MNFFCPRWNTKNIASVCENFPVQFREWIFRPLFPMTNDSFQHALGFGIRPPLLPTKHHWSTRAILNVVEACWNHLEFRCRWTGPTGLIPCCRTCVTWNNELWDYLSYGKQEFRSPSFYYIIFFSPKPILLLIWSSCPFHLIHSTLFILSSEKQQTRRTSSVKNFHWRRLPFHFGWGDSLHRSSIIIKCYKKIFTERNNSCGKVHF